MRRINKALLGLCLLTLAACEIKRPKEVLSDAQMEKVLYDYHLATAMGDMASYDENYKRELYIQYVLKKNHITRAVFDSSLVWFSNNPELMMKIYEKVNQKFVTEDEQVKKLIALRDRKGQKPASGDSVDIWFDKQLHVLSGLPLENRIDFNLPVDTTYHEGDTIEWNLGIRLNKSIKDSAFMPVMAMQLQFEKNDTVLSVLKYIRKSGFQKMRLTGDTLGEIKSIRGFVYYPMQKGKNILRTDTVSLMRYHKKENKAEEMPSDSLSNDSAAGQAAADSITKDSLR